MIETLHPMLASEHLQPFDRPGWAFELKFDGYRVLAQAGALGVRLRTRNGADCTAWFPEIARTLATVNGKGIVLDGEVCVLDELGRSDFNRLQDRARRRRWVEGLPVVFCAFDVLVDGGRAVLARPLGKRKALLDRVRDLPSVLVVDHIEEHGIAVYESAVLPMKLEGMMAKRLDSPYTPGIRSPHWLKVKRPGAVPAERFKRAEQAV